MPTPEALLSFLLILAWGWRIGSSIFSSTSISELITPTCLGNNAKLFVAALQIIVAFILNLMPLSEFPRLSLAHTILSIPSQAYSLYYANRYIGPALDSRRVAIFIYIVTVLCILETAYKINIDWSRIE